MTPQHPRLIADVSRDLTVECLDTNGQAHEIECVMGYRRQDPYAVTMTFTTTEGSLVWTYGRDLVMRGMHRPTGDGDVLVAPAISRTGTAVTLISLTSPDGHLLLETRTDQLAAFVERTLALVPSGDESIHLDMDALIAQFEL